MAVTLIIELDGVTAEQYDAVMQNLGLADGSQSWPEGAIAHYAGPAEGGWCVVDVWESREHFDRFAEERLGPATSQAGVPVPQPREVPVHNMHVI